MSRLILNLHLFGVSRALDGQHQRGLGAGAESLAKVVLERRLAFHRCMGLRAFAHGVHSLERSWEVWAAWRALFLPAV